VLFHVRNNLLWLESTVKVNAAIPAQPTTPSPRRFAHRNQAHSEPLASFCTQVRLRLKCSTFYQGGMVASLASYIPIRFHGPRGGTCFKVHGETGAARYALAYSMQVLQGMH